MATQEQNQIWLDEAEAALHKLATGAQVVELSRTSGTLKYTATNMSDLRSYIQQLKTALGQSPRRAFRPIF